MRQNKTIDGKTISSHTNDCLTPPGFNINGVKLGRGYWVRVGDDWYRWTGRNGVILSEAIGMHIYSRRRNGWK